VALPGVRPSLSQSSRGRRAFSLPHMFGADVRQLTVDQVDPTRPKGPASRRACRPNGIGNDCSAPLHAPCDVAPSLGRLPYCRSHRKGRHRSVRCPARTGSTTATEADPMTGPLGSFPRTLASTTRPCRVPGHPEAIPEHLRNIPRRIDDPATAARVALDLLRSRHEDLTLALYLDDRHRLVGHAVVATGWVQAARLSTHPILLGSQASRGHRLRPRRVPPLRSP
jgi:hypothetical protein